ncbi:MAG: gamma carbonic anhydrase family protein [Deltaproteobacteria bacterium]|jgi:carbonic anhydrase/acetyltransferase-like protein (isoleucine patch superfamily)|nr:gamma carbonic anhydrase family protein [Deltaproteobacteria bacterium]
MFLDFKDKTPRVDPSVFIADNAVVIGDVEIGPGSNVWFFSLIRGDVNFIRIGARCNIQDACILHVDRGRFPLILEDDVVLGHRVTVHGCRVGRGAMIGIGATVLSGATIGEEAIVGAGSVVTEGATIPPRTLALGTPAKVKRELSEEDLARIRQTRESYQELMKIYGTGAKP